LEACKIAESFMRYQKKYEPQEFGFAPSFAYAARMAATALDGASLNEVDAILRQSRWVQKNIGFDGDRIIATARRRLTANLAMWSLIEEHDEEAQDAVLAVGGTDQDAMSTLAFWSDHGFIRGERDAHGKFHLSLNGRMQEKTLAKCPACGSSLVAAKFLFLENGNCPKCKAPVDFLIVGRVPNSPGV
jgi:hypothetical protein